MPQSKQSIDSISKSWSAKEVAHDLKTKERTTDVLAEEVTTFEDLLLSDNVLRGVKKSGFIYPSPIQLKAIPLGRCGLDLVVQAKSGTGKTCVFSIIALESINLQSNALQVMILAPTREIALQSHAVITAMGQDLENLAAEVFIGGTLVSEDRRKAKRCHIAVGSPGRVRQLIELGVLLTGSVRLFVLDEADKLVEEGGMQEQINWIFSTLPVNKQVLALSATYPEVLAQFLTRYMRQPTFARLNSSDPSLLGLRQHYIVLKKCPLLYQLFEEKANAIIHLFRNMTFQQALIFSNYHSKAESICDALNSAGWPSTYISGNMDQRRRTVAITQLKEFKCRILISTDLTSRGIDASKVDVVVNMDLPTDWETYMHRIGRAGRFGSRGVAITLVSAGEEEQQLRALAAQCNADVSPYPGTTSVAGSRDHPVTDPCDRDVTDPLDHVTDHRVTDRSDIDVTDPRDRRVDAHDHVNGARDDNRMSGDGLNRDQPLPSTSQPSDLAPIDRRVMSARDDHQVPIVRPAPMRGTHTMTTTIAGDEAVRPVDANSAHFVDIPTHNEDNAPQNKDIAPQKDDIAPQKDDIAPQKDDIPPQKDDIPPQKDDIPPQKDDVPPQKDDVPPQKDDVPPQNGPTSPQNKDNDANGPVESASSPGSEAPSGAGHPSVPSVAGLRDRFRPYRRHQHLLHADSKALKRDMDHFVRTGQHLPHEPCARCTKSDDDDDDEVSRGMGRLSVTESESGASTPPSGRDYDPTTDRRAIVGEIVWSRPDRSTVATAPPETRRRRQAPHASGTTAPVATRDALVASGRCYGKDTRGRDDAAEESSLSSSESDTSSSSSAEFSIDYSSPSADERPDRVGIPPPPPFYHSYADYYHQPHPYYWQQQQQPWWSVPPPLYYYPYYPPHPAAGYFPQPDPEQVFQQQLYHHAMAHARRYLM